MTKKLKQDYDLKVGVISDTHGLIRKEVFKIFKGVDFIIHAGDLGCPKVVDVLKTIAKVIPVSGNVDSEEWARKLPLREAVKIGQTYFYILHDLANLDLDPETGGFDIVISGHSHMPKIKKDFNTLYLNPGSAGPKRFKLPISVALLYLKDKLFEAEIIEL